MCGQDDPDVDPYDSFAELESVCVSVEVSLGLGSQNFGVVAGVSRSLRVLVVCVIWRRCGDSQQQTCRDTSRSVAEARADLEM